MIDKFFIDCQLFKIVVVYIYYVMPNKRVLPYSEVSAWGWNDFFWEIVSEVVDFDYRKKIQNQAAKSLIEKGVRELEKVVWNPKKDVPLETKVAMAVSADYPYFKKDQLPLVAKSLRNIWRTHCKGNDSHMVMGVVRELEELIESDREFEGIYITDYKEAFTKREIWESLEPKEDEESRRMVIVKKYITVDDVVANTKEKVQEFDF